MCPTILVEKWKCKLETTYLSKGQVAKKKWENISCWTIAWRSTKRIYNSDRLILMSIRCVTVCKFKIFQPFRFYAKSILHFKMSQLILSTWKPEICVLRIFFANWVSKHVNRSMYWLISNFILAYAVRKMCGLQFYRLVWLNPFGNF